MASLEIHDGMVADQPDDMHVYADMAAQTLRDAACTASPERCHVRLLPPQQVDSTGIGSDGCEAFEDDRLIADCSFWHGAASDMQQMPPHLSAVRCAFEPTENPSQPAFLLRSLTATQTMKCEEPASTTTTQFSSAIFPLNFNRNADALSSQCTPQESILIAAAAGNKCISNKSNDSSHKEDPVTHFFLASSQSERLLDQYISSLIHAFLEDPAPIYAASNRNSFMNGLYEGVNVPAGGAPSSDSIAAYLNYIKLNVVEKATRTGSPRMIGHMTTALPFFHRPLARLLAALNQNVVKIETSSTLTNLERQTLAMLHKSFYGMPDAFYDRYTYSPDLALGSAASGGTIANIMAMWMARNRALQPNPSIGCLGVDKEGVISAMNNYGYKNAVIVGSVLMHYSFKKAADLLGIGEDGLILIPTDDAFRIRIDMLRAKIEELVASKILVVGIVGIAGTTEAGSIDPLSEMAKIANKHSIHFHVDAAWGGPLIFSPEHRHKLNGIALADSITVDGHKQLYTPMGLGVVLTRSPTLVTAIRKTANYVIRSDSTDLGKFTLEGSRPANSLHLHASLSLLGKNGIAMLINRSAALVRQSAERLSSHPSRAFEVLHEPMSNLLLFRVVPARLRGVSGSTSNTLSVMSSEDDHEANELTRRVQIRLATAPPLQIGNESPDEDADRRPPGFVSRTRVHHRGRTVDALRIVIANPLTTMQDVDGVICDLLRTATVVEGDMIRELVDRRGMVPTPPGSTNGG